MLETRELLFCATEAGHCSCPAAGNATCLPLGYTLGPGGGPHPTESQTAFVLQLPSARELLLTEPHCHTALCTCP